MKYLLIFVLITWCCSINNQSHPWRNKTATEIEEVFNTASAMFPPLI